MSDADAPEYLLDSFDPGRATAPQLRSILVAHNVTYASNAKKGNLVDLFNDYVVPQRRKILDQRARARRTSRGIVDAGSSQDTGPSQDSFDDVPNIKPPRSSRRSRSPRKAYVKSEEPEYLAAPPSPSKRATRASSRHTSLAPPEREETVPLDDGLRSVRKIRRTPEIKQEVLDDQRDPLRRVSREGNFSDDNPFQSGSSPIQVPKSAGRRKTTGMESACRNQSSSRRRSDYPEPSIEKDDLHFDDHAPMTPEPEFGMDPGEEFTPDEQLELEQEQVYGDTVVATRRRPQTQKHGMRLGTPFWVLLTALLSAFALWYRQEKVAVGYCGLGRQAIPILPDNIPVPEWAAALVEPECETCPPHAYCYEDFVAKCEHDYILTPHPLSFGGLVPLPPTCEPDGEKVRRVKAVADKAVEELRDRRAKFECGELVDEQGEQIESAAMDTEDLKESISKKRGKRMTNREFEELWEAAIGEITSREEVEVTVDVRTGDSGSVSNTFISSTSLSRIPLVCAVKRAFRQRLARYRLHLGLVATVVTIVLHLRSKYRSNRKAQEQVPALVEAVLELLATQKEVGEEGLDDGYLFLPNLRDDVLRSIHSLAEREKIWTRVRAVVEQNSNVRTSQREGRTGEVGRAWEWIGPTAGTSEAVHRRRSRMSGVGVGSGPGRASLGSEQYRREKVEEEDDATPSKGEHKGGGASFKKWEEKSRPIY